MGRKSMRKCEVCGVRVKRPRGSDPHVFLASFPLEPDRCRLWVKATGNEDLAHLPLVRLHENKFVCGDHFSPSAFNTKGNRLRRNAIPTLNLNAPLSDEILSSFPIIREFEESETDAGQVLTDHTYNRRKHEDHNYCSTHPARAETFEPPVAKTHSDDDDWRESFPAYEDNNSLPRPFTPPEGYGVPASRNIKDKSTNNDPKHGIDPSSLDEFQEPSTEGIFSWQKQQILYPTEDTDVLMCPGADRGEELKQDLGDVSLYDDPAPELDTHAEYQCNVCENQIKGFRYTCVQCADWDLCGACEARAGHAAHYVLRVPSPRPYNEIQAVLAAIRQQLLSENLFLSEQITEDSLKSEPEERLEEEAEEEAEGEAEVAPAEPDPLRALSVDGGRKRNLEDSEDEYTDGSEYRPPRRKRRRRFSDSSDSSQATTLPDTHNPSDPLLCSPEPTHDGLSSETPEKQSDTSRRKPLTRSATHPNKHLDLMKASHSISNQSDNQPDSDVFELPAAVYQVSNNTFQVSGTVFEVPGAILEVPAAMGVTDCVLTVPDNATVFIQDYDTCDSVVDSIYNVEAVGSLGERGELLRLRVPHDTDDAALAQALQSQAYVVMQPNLEVPDDSTVLIQKPPNTCDSLVDSISTSDDAVGNLEDNREVLHLRVPPDTDDAALAQALTSQAYVVMQPLAFEQVIDNR